MRLLLDTVTFIWAVTDPRRLSRSASAALGKASAIREVSVVSLTEIAVKSARGRLAFTRSDTLTGIGDLQARVMAYSAEHALRLFELPTHHADPFDRQLIAQALAEDIVVVTPDEAFKTYRGLKIVW